MKNVILVLALVASTSAFASPSSNSYEVCKGFSRNGDTITLVGNFDNKDTVQVNSQGERLEYNVEGIDGGDVHQAFTSDEHGGLKVTFYDEDNSASGWSSKLGAFKLSCKTVEKN